MFRSSAFHPRNERAIRASDAFPSNPLGNARAARRTQVQTCYLTCERALNFADQVQDLQEPRKPSDLGSCPRPFESDGSVRLAAMNLQGR